jgi:hypothetical protein
MFAFRCLGILGYYSFPRWIQSCSRYVPRRRFRAGVPCCMSPRTHSSIRPFNPLACPQFRSIGGTWWGLSPSLSEQHRLYCEREFCTLCNLFPVSFPNCYNIYVQSKAKLFGRHPSSCFFYYYLKTRFRILDSVPVLR